MNKTEHSPLPWIAGGWDGPIDCVYDANGDAVCEPSPQNADHIVTACNSYYDNQQAIAELVEALNVLCICAIQSNLRVEFEKEIADATTLMSKHKAKP